MTLPQERPDADDLPHTEWRCETCGFDNSCLDGKCQNPDCEGEPVEVPCIDGTENHEWLVSDDNENICYCTRCGCLEY